MGEILQHLVLVRHGESEGDVRRSAWRRGNMVPATKKPEQEEITARGAEQSHQAGLWIQKHIVQACGLGAFDGCYVSSALRSEQSAVALDLSIAMWQGDNCLDERNRGKIRGWLSMQHEQAYPDSFRQMKVDPLHWVPPGGESLVPDVVSRVKQFIDNIEGAEAVLAVTHRDWMWAAQLVLENLSEDDLLAVNTDEIHNAQVVEYTSINPATGEQAPVLLWKRSVDPTATSDSGAWQILPRVAELNSLAA
ncbi:MAG TPA: phosphoglycerate mutase family protein [Candidatus Saccharimonadales bacterium]|nr:phosphoglycerate mutase family protein [Candidatus Saccharimonadales bacterium]